MTKARRPRRGGRPRRRFAFSGGAIRLALLGGCLALLAAGGVEGGSVAEAAAPAKSVGGGTAGTASRQWRIIDGDTFAMGEETIRIADIDTPEVRGRCAHETALAARTTARMEALLAEGPFELVRSGRDEDRYGRKLRIVTRRGRSLGDRLVAEGVARTWTGRREPWCQG